MRTDGNDAGNGGVETSSRTNTEYEICGAQTVAGTPC
jgi:hypothetical protein